MRCRCSARRGAWIAFVVTGSPVTRLAASRQRSVWGILLLLIVGYGWLLQIGTDVRAPSPWPGRIMAFLYGVGAALTLDEFALWLNLSDVYWERQGRASIDAVVLFGALLLMGVMGGRFLHALAREALRRPRRQA